MKFTNITNKEATNFEMAGANNTKIDAIVLSKIVPANNVEGVTLCTFNVLTGASTSVYFKVPTSHVKEGFAAALASAWYEIQYKKAFAIKENAFLSLNEDSSEEDKAAYAVLETRYNIVRDVRNAHKAIPCATVRDIACALARRPLKEYSTGVKGAYSKLSKVKITTDNSNSNTVVNLKEYRTALDEFTRTIWRESEYCSNYVFHCNAHLTFDVACVAHPRRKIDSKTGLVAAVPASDNAVVVEIMLAIVESIQTK